MAAHMYKKGHPKLGGRSAGTPNKSTVVIRNAFQKLIEDNLDQLQEDLNSLKPAARIDAMIKLSEYVLPKLNRTEHTGEDGSPIDSKIEIVRLDEDKAK